MSNNARPVPEIALDRAVSKPFETKWLSWLGPWRLTTFVGQMEGSRDDYAHPVFWGMRVSARPLDGLEISLERTAQLCGEGRSCTWNDFWNMFTGNDNARRERRSRRTSRATSWRAGTSAGHRPSATGTMRSTTSTPARRSTTRFRGRIAVWTLLGLETWGDGSGGGSSWRAGFEWSNTRCGGTENGQKLWDCAYNNSNLQSGWLSLLRPGHGAFHGRGRRHVLGALHPGR